MEKKIKKPARLYIKNPETDRLARELAELTGESITVAVKVALRERLENLRSLKKRKRDAKVAALLEIGRRGGEMFKGPSIDHAEMLYDENGLPK
jgi:antitoxin VapB